MDRPDLPSNPVAANEVVALLSQFPSRRPLNAATNEQIPSSNRRNHFDRAAELAVRSPVSFHSKDRATNKSQHFVA